MHLTLYAHNALQRVGGRYVNITWLVVSKPHCRSLGLPKLSSMIPWQKRQLLGPTAPGAEESVQSTASLCDEQALGHYFCLTLMFPDFIHWPVHYTQQ